MSDSFDEAADRYAKEADAQARVASLGSKMRGAVTRGGRFRASAAIQSELAAAAAEGVYVDAGSVGEASDQVETERAEVRGRQAIALGVATSAFLTANPITAARRLRLARRINRGDSPGSLVRETPGLS